MHLVQSACKIRSTPSSEVVCLLSIATGSNVLEATLTMPFILRMLLLKLLRYGMLSIAGAHLSRVAASTSGKEKDWGDVQREPP